MTRRNPILSVVLLAASLVGVAACAHEQTAPETLLIPPGTITGRINARPEAPLYSTRSESLGTIVAPGATGSPAAETTVTSTPNGTVTVISTPGTTATASATSVTPPVTQPRVTVNGSYGPLEGDIVTPPSSYRTTGVITH